MERPAPPQPPPAKPLPKGQPSQPLPKKPQPSQPLPKKPQPSQPLPKKPQPSQPLPNKPQPPQKSQPLANGQQAPQRPPRPPRRPPAQPPVRTDADRLVMTDQMEPIDDSTKYRRKIDDSLARFGAAHDEIAAEEAKRKQRRERLTARPAQLLEQTRTKLQRVVLPGSDQATKLTGPAKRPADAPAMAAADAPEKDEPEKAAQTRLQEKKERRNLRSLKTGRITAIVLAAVVFLATGVAWGTKTWFNSKFNQIAALDENSQDIQNAAGQRGDENFLIIGSDTRAGAEAEEGVGSADGVPGARADTMMIAHIPADRSRVVAVSFPRDLEVSRPECQRFDHGAGKYTDQKVEALRTTKLNSVYMEGGPACVIKLAQQMTGMRLNHFVGVDFNGFKGMVDAAGGVPVHLDKPIDDTTLGKIFPQAGDLVLTGDQALNYVRARHVKGDPTSDYGRIKRQQEFIGSLLRKAMSRDVILDPGKLTAFVTAFANATFGDNIGVDQLLTLAQSMQGMDSGRITFLTVPTTGNANSRGNEVLMLDKANSVFRSLIENTPLPDEKLPAADGSAGGAAQPTKPSE
ncbi:LCP family protein [Amycolatopsis nigrescens]|uniref:LCP family protein n=1 Tax=Amycolatopsis nigrescens TaxID=381445 RepID=UPI000382073D